MDDRREDGSIRTDRPKDAAADASLPTVRELLALPQFVEGLPEVVVGGPALDARVRWAHVSDSAGVARLLNGGELLLSTGSGWPADPAALRGFIADLVVAGLSGLVLELGTHYRYLPAVVAEAARAHKLALVTLHREVKYVALTEAVHNRIISEQTAALRARDEVRERFTALALRGAPADYIVRQLAQTLAAPVVLENLAHEVIVAEMPPALEEELLSGWEYRSRAAHREPGEWLVVPVEARGTRWGHLVLLPGPPHPAGRRGVLEQGAIALAFGRLADGESDEWARLARRRLLDALMTGRFAGAGAAAARLEAAGVPVSGARLHGIVLAGAPVVPEAVDAAARGLRGRALTGSAPSGIPGPSAAILLSLPAGVEFDDRTARAFARASAGDAADRSVLSVGAVASGLDEALASLQEAIGLAAGVGWREGRGLRLRRGDDRPLVRLLTTLRDDHRLLEHGERMLAPLIDYDLARDGDLLDVLGAMLAHPGNRTAAASASHLSRSVFYQRIALIEDLLGTDLDDGETQAALHVALLVRRAARR